MLMVHNSAEGSSCKLSATLSPTRLSELSDDPIIAPRRGGPLESSSGLWAAIWPFSGGLPHATLLSGVSGSRS